MVGSKRADIPVYSFEQHQRQKETVSIYSPHVVILEGILTLQDPRVLEMLDLKIFVEADADVCLSRRSKFHCPPSQYAPLIGQQASRP